VIYRFLLDPPDLFSDDGTLTPDALRDGEGTDESPLHMNSKNINKYGQGTGIPTEKLKKIRINRKDFKKGGDGLRGKNVTEQFRVKDKDMKRTMKWRTPEISMKYLAGKSPLAAIHDKPPDQNKDQNSKNSAKSMKHERPRSKPAIYQNETGTEGSSEDILDEDDEEVSNVYRKISERREELNRARRNGDDCHVSWYPVSFGSEMNSQTLHQNNSSTRSAMRHANSASAAAAEKLVDENAILLLDQDQLVAVHCNGNGKSSSIERARAKRSSKV